MYIRRMLTVAALLAGSVVSVVVTGAPAYAALATCNGASEVKAASPKGNVVVQLPTYNGNPDCTLRRGNYDNWGVVVLQLALRDCSGVALTVDGDYGADTEAVVKWIQAANGLTPDGVYGPNTRSIVKWKTSAGCLIGVKPL